MNLENHPKYYAVFAETKFNSWQEVMQNAAAEVKQHVARSKELHEAGKLVMSGAFLDRPEEPVTTMGILCSREDADEYMHGDPFVINNMVSRW